MKAYGITGSLLAASALFLTTSAVAQTGGFVANPGTSVSPDGVITLDSRGQPAGTSLENPNLGIQVENGDVISFEYKGDCGGGAPRVFIQGGAYNTFDGNTCGTATTDGYSRITGTISGITSGPAGYTGVVNDNPSNQTVILVRNVTIAGVNIFAPANASQCKNGGYRFGNYKNQGDCVSSFRSNR